MPAQAVEDDKHSNQQYRPPRHRSQPQDKQERKRRQNNLSNINSETMSTTKEHEARNAARYDPPASHSTSTRGYLINLRESVKSGEVEMDNSSGRPSDIKTAVSNTERNYNVHGSTHLQDSPSPTTNGAKASRRRTEALNANKNLPSTITADDATLWEQYHHYHPTISPSLTTAATTLSSSHYNNLPCKARRRRGQQR